MSEKPASIDGGKTVKASAVEESELEKTEVKAEVVAAEGSDGDEGSESDDPDRLWCICHRPHDDR